ncbi:site-specific integrase [Nonomuraea angiospora]|uniref:tyrosine-type recombinase/integrase n=1 Tax=Nonomuraea angiospora TaxID=46172 RepID=UPI003441E1FB
MDIKSVRRDARRALPDGSADRACGSPAGPGRRPPGSGDGQEHALPASVVEPAGVRPADRNPYLMYVGGLDSAESRRTMAGCLAEVARMLGYGDPVAVPWEALRFAHVARLRALMSERSTARDGEPVPWAPSTINKHLSAVRGVAKTAWRLGLMSADDLQRVQDVKGVKGSRVPAGRNVAAAELAAMLTACLAGGTLIGIRNAAVIAVLASTGARRAELAGARREHYDPGERSLRIVGKGNKEREVYLTEESAVYVGAWLARTAWRTGPLFLPVDRWGNVARRHLTTKAVADAVNTARDAAGLTAHDFRRTFIGELLDSGADLATAQALVGHANPTTTARYDRRPAATRRAAVARLHIPRPEDLAVDPAANAELAAALRKAADVAETE